MTYKTILAHLKDEAHTASILQLARPMAEAHQAHLIGLTVMPLVDGPAKSLTSTDALLRQYRAAIRQEARVIEAAFKARQPLETFPIEWRLVDLGFETVEEIVARHGRAADLIIASQDSPDWQSSGLMRDSAGVIAMAAGRPVLVVPMEPLTRPCGERVIVAWNGSREAARSVFDALPLLTRAHHVTVLTITDTNERDTTSLSGSQSGEALCASLYRHGIAAELRVEPPSSDGVASNLLSAIERFDAGVLVMGDYGRSRISEMIFGGATRSILRDMKIPVLLSH